MQYIYHIVPRNLVGEILYPLNRLKDIEPALYNEHVQKYEGREYLLSRHIPKLDCLWNDVVQCAPIHPTKIYQAITDSGFDVPTEYHWFQIPVQAIRLPMAIYNNQRPGGLPEPLDEDVITMISPDEYCELDTFPDTTMAWYAKLKAEGKSLRGLFHHCPHVFVKGPIHLPDASVISWA